MGASVREIFTQTAFQILPRPLKEAICPVTMVERYLHETYNGNRKSFEQMKNLLSRKGLRVGREAVSIMSQIDREASIHATREIHDLRLQAVLFIGNNCTRLWMEKIDRIAFRTLSALKYL